jgi:hypothetical protein
MVGRNVCYLVRDHSCHFCFIIRSQNQAARWAELEAKST